MKELPYVRLSLTELRDKYVSFLDDSKVQKAYL